MDFKALIAKSKDSVAAVAAVKQEEVKSAEAVPAREAKINPLAAALGGLSKQNTDAKSVSNNPLAAALGVKKNGSTIDSTVGTSHVPSVAAKPINDTPVASVVYSTVTDSTNRTSTSPSVTDEAISGNPVVSIAGSTRAANAVAASSVGISVPAKITDEAIHAEKPSDIDESVEETDEEGDEDDDTGGIEPAELLAGIGAEEFNHSSQPEKFTQEEVRDFEQAFEILKGNFDYPEQIGQSIAHCMIMLRDKPHLKDLMKEENARLMVQALRVGYGTAIVVKKAAAAKRTKKSTEIDDFASQLSAMGVSGIGEIKL